MSVLVEAIRSMDLPNVIGRAETLAHQQNPTSNSDWEWESMASYFRKKGKSDYNRPPHPPRR